MNTTKRLLRTALFGLAFTVLACGGESLGPAIPDGWDIPKEGISVGCPGGRDCIPSLNEPAFIPAEQATYLRDDDLVIGLEARGVTRAYPLKILNWHEVVNDVVGGFPIAVTYSPLTATGIAFDRLLAPQVLEFGVSGLVYNNNTILYDRNTGSHWTQMRLRADQGPLRGIPLFPWRSMQITWGGWRRLNPDTEVLSDQTGFPRDYAVYPYGDYPNNDDFLFFPLLRDDRRLPRKTMVHGVVVSGFVKVWKHEDFTTQEVLNERVGGQPIVIIADPSLKLVVSYSSIVPPGVVLTFRMSVASNQFPFALRDEQTQSLWDIQGRAFSGPMAGVRLQSLESYNGFWFAWAAMHSNVEIAER